MKESKALFFSSKFPWARKIISSKFIDSFVKRLQKFSPTLIQSNWKYADPSTERA
jgi:hypothetical protein